MTQMTDREAEKMILALKAILESRLPEGKKAQMMARVEIGAIAPGAVAGLIELEEGILPPEEGSEPITGVCAGRKVAYFYEESHDGISLTWLAAEAEYRLENGLDEDDDLPDDFYDGGFGIGEELLVGQWKQGEDGKYEPDTEDPGFEYAAIYDSDTDVCQVVASKWVAGVAAMCSPCYPGQADLDSGPGEIKAYCFPIDMYDENVDDLPKILIGPDGSGGA